MTLWYTLTVTVLESFLEQVVEVLTLQILSAALTQVNKAAKRSSSNNAYKRPEIQCLRQAASFSAEVASKLA